AGDGTILSSSHAGTLMQQDLRTNTVIVWGVAYGNGTFAAVGKLAGPVFSASAILTSANGMTWTSRTSGILDQAYYDVACGNGTFVAVGLRDVKSGASAI